MQDGWKISGEKTLSFNVETFRELSEAEATSKSSNPYTDLCPAYYDWVDGGCLFLLALRDLCEIGPARGNLLTSDIRGSLPRYRS